MTYLNHYNEEDKVLVAVDCIIFGFDEEGLKILFVKRGFEPEKGKWSLMGGFLKREENLAEAATRVLFHLQVYRTYIWNSFILIVRLIGILSLGRYRFPILH